MTICVVSLSTASGLKLLSFLKRQTALAKTAEIFPPLLRLCQPGGNPLQNGCRHADKLKPNAFRCKRVNKPSERRCAWCISHLSSGVAERLRANRNLSCSLSPGPFLRSLSMLCRLFFTCRNVSLMTFAVNPARFRKISE